jgi:hypothetical protein
VKELKAEEGGKGITKENNFTYLIISTSNF